MKQNMLISYVYICDVTCHICNAIVNYRHSVEFFVGIQWILFEMKTNLLLSYNLCLIVSLLMMMNVCSDDDLLLLIRMETLVTFRQIPWTVILFCIVCVPKIVFFLHFLISMHRSQLAFVSGPAQETHRFFSILRSENKMIKDWDFHSKKIVKSHFPPNKENAIQKRLLTRR